MGFGIHGTFLAWGCWLTRVLYVAAPMWDWVVERTEVLYVGSSGFLGWARTIGVYGYDRQEEVSMATASVQRPDTHEMVVTHRASRRESRVLAAQVPRVRAGDVGRARVLADHLTDYLLALHLHHSAEDEFLWPLLLARLDLEADRVRRMEEQHERLAAGMARMNELAPVWAKHADVESRDALSVLLAEHVVILNEHLDDEEQHVLPLVEQHVSVCEWDKLSEHFAAHMPREKLLFFMGAVLEDADRRERAHLLGSLPLPARLAWHTVGRVKYARRVRSVRGA
jgi:hemerythrin-like domain-containing protein